MSKRYFLKVYDIRGKYLTSWNDATLSGFSKNINGGLGECKIQLARKFDDFGEGFDINLANEVRIYVSDVDSGAEGTRIYSGFISSYEPFFEGEREGVNVTCLGYATHLHYYPLTYYSTYGITNFAEFDCAYFVKAFLDYYRKYFVYESSTASTASFTLPTTFHKITYTTGSGGSIPDNSGNTATFSWSECTMYEAIERIREIAPANWWWYVDANNLLHFKKKPIVPTHKFILGKDFKAIKVKKNMESLRNHLRFWNGLMTTDDNYLRENYGNETSQEQYYLWSENKTDGRVTVDATADYFGASFLGERAEPSITTEIEIIDNNDNNGGYDIESINPGDTCTLLGFKIGSSTFEDNMTIAEVKYNLDTVTLTLWNKGIETGRMFRQLDNKLEENILSDAGN